MSGFPPRSAPPAPIYESGRADMQPAPATEQASNGEVWKAIDAAMPMLAQYHCPALLALSKADKEIFARAILATQAERVQSSESIDYEAERQAFGKWHAVAMNRYDNDATGTTPEPDKFGAWLASIDARRATASKAEAPNCDMAQFTTAWFGGTQPESVACNAALRAAPAGQHDASLMALRLVQKLSCISMRLAADLVQCADRTFQGNDYLSRMAVVDRVVQWRTEWDATYAAREELAARCRAEGGATKLDDSKAEAAPGVTDEARLDFMAEHEAYIAWGRDHERCRVFQRDEDGDGKPMAGWVPEAWGDDPRDAIDRAIAANTKQGGAA